MRTKTTRATWLSLVTAAAVTATALTLAGTPGVAFAASAATIDGSTTFQTIAGFGASEAFGEASAVMNASSSVRQQALDLLYSPTSGAGLNILRNEISADPGSTIEPNNPGGPSATLNYVPLSQTNQDQGQLWLAQQIKSRCGVNNVFADAWSAPAFMKTNGATANGGQVYSGSSQLCLDANGHGTSPGTKVVTWTCNGQANQQWQVNANGTITGVQSGLCLDVSGASTADGALVELWTCNGGSNQQWTLG